MPASRQPPRRRPVVAGGKHNRDTTLSQQVARPKQWESHSSSITVGITRRLTSDIPATLARHSTNSFRHSSTAPQPHLACSLYYNVNESARSSSTPQLECSLPFSLPRWSRPPTFVQHHPSNLVQTMTSIRRPIYTTVRGMSPLPVSLYPTLSTRFPRSSLP